jgi:hypothetical protein
VAKRRLQGRRRCRPRPRRVTRAPRTSAGPGRRRKPSEEDGLQRGRFSSSLLLLRLLTVFLLYFYCIFTVFLLYFYYIFILSLPYLYCTCSAHLTPRTYLSVLTKDRRSVDFSSMPPPSPVNPLTRPLSSSQCRSHVWKPVLRYILATIAQGFDSRLNYSARSWCNRDAVDDDIGDGGGLHFSVTKCCRRYVYFIVAHCLAWRSSVKRKIAHTRIGMM